MTGEQNRARLLLRVDVQVLMPGRAATWGMLELSTENRHEDDGNGRHTEIHLSNLSSLRV
jgi:hypothetical protein